ncbi:MAG TPA: antibiotic biosynthesis monooxygenase [Candidatus Polarisedimenticolia bacterium]|jgi:heme-degrading monooxygenase HmoA|nr:antibiotic biosynthesis monooxygenase [Candidatus Polarisedimenticolia bacterium]
MIARTWHGRVPVGKSEAYHDFLRRIALRDYRATSGNRGVYVLRRVVGGEAHFLLVSLWNSLESVRAFAGSDPEKARYYPEDDSFLLEKEPHVTHYEVLEPEGEALG